MTMEKLLYERTSNESHSSLLENGQVATDVGIVQRIAAYAAVNPSKTALLDTQGEMSYGQLETTSASLACELAATGVRQGDAVAVYVPYGKDILVGAVSALRAGGIYIPFDEAYPVERLETMLQDSEAKAILTVQELWNCKPLGFPEERVIFMDEAETTKEDSHLSQPTPHLSEDSPAMLLYTSGTTGRPKGVLHTHKMLTHLVDWMNIHEGAEMNESTRTGVMAGISFVGTQMFLLGPLSKGGTVCFAPETARKDVGFLYQFIQEVGVTHIFLPAALAAIMAEDYDISGRFIFAAGEKLRNFKAHNPGNVLINSYGCTETSGVLSKKIYGNEERVLVGKPFSNTKTLIVDEKRMNAGMMLASCGTAFALRYARAAMEGGIELGLYPAEAKAAVYQTMKGAVELAMAHGTHPEAEIDRVTTPGGITIRGLNAMEEAGFTAAVIAGLKA